MRDVILIEDDKGRREIDLTPVKRIVKEIEGYKELSPQLGAIQALDQEQLKYLAVDLMFLVRRYRDLYDHSFTPEHEDFVKSVRMLKGVAKDAGVTLWPEIPT